MKVLHVYKTYLPEDFTGVPRVIHALAEGMLELDVHSEVLALGRRGGGTTLAIDNHCVHLARRDVNLASTGLSLSAFGLFRRLSSSVDIVHYHFPWPFADLLHFSAPPPAPTVITYHSDIVRQQRLLSLYAPLRDRFLGSVDQLIATSPNYLASSPVLQKFSDKTKVIPIGIPDAAPDPSDIAHWRQRVGEGFFLFVGALRYYKGLTFLLEAARQTGLPVVVAGEGDIAALGSAVPDNVTVLGAISDADKLALLDLCRAFVFPSHLRSEAFGVSLLEAARAGRAMISNEIGTGTSFVNADHQTGLVISPANPAALGEAMLALGNSDLARRYGLAARERYEGLFRSQTMAAAHLELYQTLIRARLKPAPSNR